MLQVASTQDLALGQRDVAEVMAGGTALHPTEADEVTVIHKRPVLHALNTKQYISTTRNQRVVASVEAKDPTALRISSALFGIHLRYPIRCPYSKG